MQAPVAPPALVFPLAPVITREVTAVVPWTLCIALVFALARTSAVIARTRPSVRLATWFVLPDGFAIATVVGGPRSPGRGPWLRTRGPGVAIGRRSRHLPLLAAPTVCGCLWWRAWHPPLLAAPTVCGCLRWRSRHLRFLAPPDMRGRMGRGLCGDLGHQEQAQQQRGPRRGDQAAVSRGWLPRHGVLSVVCMPPHDTRGAWSTTAIRGDVDFQVSFGQVSFGKGSRG